MNEYLLVLICTAIIYFFLIAAIILFGKKELSQLSIIDLVFILLISNAVQNAMVNGEWKSLWMGLVAAATLFILNYGMKILIFKSAVVNKIIVGDPILLIYNGEMIDENLRKQKISLNEIQSAVREHGIEDIANVSLAMLETNGNISVLSYEETKKTMFKRKRKESARNSD